MAKDNSFEEFKKKCTPKGCSVIMTEKEFWEWNKTVWYESRRQLLNMMSGPSRKRKRNAK